MYPFSTSWAAILLVVCVFLHHPSAHHSETLCIIARGAIQLSIIAQLVGRAGIKEATIIHSADVTGERGFSDNTYTCRHGGGFSETRWNPFRFSKVVAKYLAISNAWSIRPVTSTKAVSFCLSFPIHTSRLAPGVHDLTWVRCRSSTIITSQGCCKRPERLAGSSLTLISVLPIINPAERHLQGVCTASTTHGHLRHVIDIVLLIVAVLFVEQTAIL
jgi:hypothetical protein